MTEDNNSHENEELGFLQEMIEAVRDAVPQEAQHQAALRKLTERMESQERKSPTAR